MKNIQKNSFNVLSWADDDGEIDFSDTQVEEPKRPERHERLTLAQQRDLLQDMIESIYKIEQTVLDMKQKIYSMLFYLKE